MTNRELIKELYKLKNRVNNKQAVEYIDKIISDVNVGMTSRGVIVGLHDVGNIVGRDNRANKNITGLMYNVARR